VLAAGRLVLEGRAHAYRPGAVASASMSRELLGAAGRPLFLTTSWALAVSVAPTEGPLGERGLYGALDVSGGLGLGGTIANVWSPYLSARVFGGPVWFSAAGGWIPGHDPDHYSVGLGSVLTLPKNLEVGIDAALWGARGLTATAGIGF